MTKENISLKDPISFMQEHLGYIDREMKIFLKDPRVNYTQPKGCDFLRVRNRF